MTDELLPVPRLARNEDLDIEGDSALKMFPSGFIFVRYFSF